MKKKLLMICFGTILAISLCGCGDSTKEKTYTQSEVDAMLEEKESAQDNNADTEEESTSEAQDNEVTSESEVEEEPTEEPTEEASSEEVPSEVQTTAKETSIVNPYTGSLTPSEGFEFESNGDGTCTITGIGTCSDTNIIIPATSPDGEAVSKIDDDAFYRIEADYIVFNGLTLEIGESAFSSGEEKNVVISDCTITLDDDAFAYSDKLENFTVLNSQVTVGEYSLYNSGDDMNVSFGSSSLDFAESALSGFGAISLVIDGCDVQSGDDAFAYSDDIESVVITNSSVELGEYAFYNTGHKAEFLFEGCDLEMDASAFSGCNAVSLTISTESDLEISEDAIAYCDDIENISITCPEITINEYAFYNDDDLTEISIDTNSGSAILNDDAFSGSGAETITIKCASVEIGDNAFAYNDNLTSVTIDGSISKKGSYMFYNCPDDISITIGGVSYTIDSIEE